ncbi:MAG: transcriptional regulator NrdR [Planctomycetota bacterium]|nr:transcriptional regulator NrdR [Planctomycetota bacterium]
MKCPSCGIDDDKVVDSRTISEGRAVRRRRECNGCRRRLTTYERMEEVTRLVVKKNQNRQEFSRTKVLDGLITACQKRPISIEQMETIVDEVEKQIRERFDREVPSVFIGETVSEQLRELDPVAYVRFASVYQEFADVSQFLKELTPLLEKREIEDVR